MDKDELIKRHDEISDTFNSLISVICEVYRNKEIMLRNEFLKEHCDIEVGDIVFGEGFTIIVRDIRIVIEYGKLYFIYHGEQLRNNLSVRHGLYYDIQNVEKVIKRNRL